MGKTGPRRDQIGVLGTCWEWAAAAGGKLLSAGCWSCLLETDRINLQI